LQSEVVNARVRPLQWHHLVGTHAWPRIRGDSRNRKCLHGWGGMGPGAHVSLAHHGSLRRKMEKYASAHPPDPTPLRKATVTPGSCIAAYGAWRPDEWGQSEGALEERVRDFDGFFTSLRAPATNWRGCATLPASRIVAGGRGVRAIASEFRSLAQMVRVIKKGYGRQPKPAEVMHGRC